MRTFLHRITRLTPIAIGIAAGLIVVGVLAIVAGSYSSQVVHDQLAPQQIYFPKAGDPALPQDLEQYAGQLVDDGAKAKAYADKYINVHLGEVAGGKTYAQVSQEAMADPENQQLAAQKQTLFQGETLRGLLLSVWGWSVVGAIATAAGIVMVVLGAILLLLPLLNWLLNERGGRQPPGGGGDAAGAGAA